VGAVATPLVLVVTCTVARFPGNVPLAPLEGAVNVTVTPSKGRELLSFTVTESVAKAVLMATL
jgi:hypothetical protein